MKFKLLLCSLLLISGFLSAQDSISSLIISEARMDRGDKSYLEITNLGDTAINLNVIELGVIRPWSPSKWEPETGRRMMLPDFMLGPGESYVMGSLRDWNEEQYWMEVNKLGYSPNYSIRETYTEMWDLVDFGMHSPEDPLRLDPTDSVTTDPVWGDIIHFIFSDVWTRECWILRHHISETDSAVIDQVGGVFDEDGLNGSHAYDVAGITDATGSHLFVRKYVVKNGNLDFATGRGVDRKDSEWIPIQLLDQGTSVATRVPFWTIGNHGNFIFEENTLESKYGNIEIDLVDSILTVPWGLRQNDTVMYQFKRKPGLAWRYDYAENHEDSAFVSVRTGDKLTVWACGDSLQEIVFDIEVLDPPMDANIVIPKKRKTNDGTYEVGSGSPDGNVPWDVTNGLAMDTISDVLFATRVDTLLKYLEKAPNASWEIDWVDDVERTDVKNGDILVVTAEDGTSMKEYFIKVSSYRESLDAYLSSITWPDITDKEFYGSVYGWKGDTIPSFVAGKFNYKVLLPFDQDAVPALVGKPSDINTTVVTERAANLTGSLGDRTSYFHTTADDDTTEYDYTVVFSKEKNPVDLQPWVGAEPFISEILFWEQWSNGFVEVVNPGTEPLDLSNYMFYAQGNATPVGAIEWPGTDLTGATWRNRYAKYIPGYKWTADSNEWKVEAYIAEEDLSVTPTVQGGDVMVFGHIATTSFSYGDVGYGKGNWPLEDELDVVFYHSDPDIPNQWDNDDDIGNVWCRQWTGANIYMFKILNDSIQRGLKAATDPNDFMLMETFGGLGNAWAPGGYDVGMITTMIRKPQFYLAKAGIEESWGPTPEHDSCEWIMYNDGHFSDQGYGWAFNILATGDDFGAHFMNDVTIYRSTVSSNAYIVSSGYSMDETILGVVDGETVDGFEVNIIKADTGQVLTLKASSDGAILTGTDVLLDGDTLIVLSQDGTNTSKYVLDVTAGGLDDNAVLTSTMYTVAYDGATGTISGMEYGTTVVNVKDNVTVPPGATLTIVDENDAWVPLKKLNFDTMYVDVQVADNIFFHVLAQDGATSILYQITPTATATDAFVTSDVFSVNEANSIIEFIPRNTTVPMLLGNLVAAPGATVVLVDKLGMEREFGNVSRDDKLIVTSQDGTVTNVYYLTLLPLDEENVILYLAYVLSDVYDVDQIDLTIEGDTDLDTDTDVATLIANVTPASGATVMVVDDMDVENTGTLMDGDLLKVTAGDGVTTAFYSLDVFILSTGALDNGSVLVYPNPSTGMITVSGMEAGNRIRVYNMLGSAVHDVIANQANEVISLQSQPSGIYFVVVGDGDETIGRYKLILE